MHSVSYSDWRIFFFFWYFNFFFITPILLFRTYKHHIQRPLRINAGRWGVAHLLKCEDTRTNEKSGPFCELDNFWWRHDQSVRSCYTIRFFFSYSVISSHWKKKKRAQSYKSGATPIADLVLMGCYYYQNRLTTAITRHIPMKSRYVTATGSCIQMGQCTDLFFFQFTFKENGR